MKESTLKKTKNWRELGHQSSICVSKVVGCAKRCNKKILFHWIEIKSHNSNVTAHLHSRVEMLADSAVYIFLQFHNGDRKNLAAVHVCCVRTWYLQRSSASLGINFLLKRIFVATGYSRCRTSTMGSLFAIRHFDLGKFLVRERLCIVAIPSRGIHGRRPFTQQLFYDWMLFLRRSMTHISAQWFWSAHRPVAHSCLSTFISLFNCLWAHLPHACTFSYVSA